MENIPSKINKIVKDIEYRVDDVGKSKDKVIIYSNKYVLKISTNINQLKKEYDKGLWLVNHLPTSKPILFIVENNKAYYLKEYLEGTMLIDKSIVSNPLKLIDYIKEAFDMLDKVKDCPFNNEESIGNVFVHGDICLPNILIKDDHVSGFIDIENCGNGDKWLDYAWIIWSLQRNLHTDIYNQSLLDKLGIEYNKEKYEKYIPLELRNKMGE